MFKRRDRRPVWRIIYEFFLPRGGWYRAALYIKHRLRRLPDPPHRIARGIFAGLFTTFTPFYGFHFLTAAAIAWVMRGNILAALLATFAGNPLTYVPIGVIALKTGYFLMGMEPHMRDMAQLDDEVHRSLAGKFVDAGHDLLNNLTAGFTGKPRDWHGLEVFWDTVFLPYLVGGIVPGIVFGLVGYYLSLPLLVAYQKRREVRRAQKAAALQDARSKVRAQMEAAAAEAARIEADAARRKD